jgi:hypothetical protein
MRSRSFSRPKGLGSQRLWSYYEGIWRSKSYLYKHHGVTIVDLLWRVVGLEVYLAP